MKRLFLAMVVMMVLVAAAWGNPIDIVVSCDNRGQVKDEIVSAIMGLETKSPITLKEANDYLLIFDQETQGVLASMFMNPRTLKNPVYRLTYNIIPNGVNTIIRSQVEVISNPDTPNALAVMGDSKKVDPDLYGILSFIKGRLEGKIDVTMSEYIQIQKSKPKLGISVGGNGIITSVVPKSHAAKAKIKKGDRIIEIDGETVTDNAQALLFNKIGAGHLLKLRLQRKDKQWNVKIQL